MTHDDKNKNNEFSPQGIKTNMDTMPAVTDNGIKTLRVNHNLKNDDTSVVLNDSPNCVPSAPEEDYSLLSFFSCCNKTSQQDHLNVEKKSKTRSVFVKLWKSILVLLFVIYFVAVLIIHSEAQEAENSWCNADGFLIIVTIVVSTGIFYFKVFKPYIGRFILKSFKKLYLKSFLIRNVTESLMKWYVSSLVYATVFGLLGIFLYFDTKDDRSRLMSAAGILVLCLVGFLFSSAPRKVIWRPVFWGIGLQFVLGFIVLRSHVGRATFTCLGDKCRIFFQFTDAGSSFVFGELVTGMKVFAFRILTITLFFSFCIQILYHYGAMQWMVMKLGWLLQVTIGTTACESVNAAANIFLGQSEAPLVIKPFLGDMTKSELHAVMTGGFASVAGSSLAAYMSFGVNPTHLLSASVMSAPAALGISKLLYPETEISRNKVENIKIKKDTEANVLHAAIEGVTVAIPLIANIAANLIAFIAFISFVDATFNWACRLINIEDGVCSFAHIMGYPLMPLAWVMGVPWNDCYYVGQLIGTKTVVNEFIAYIKLSEYIKGSVISKRSEAIATYALCGFSNITSVGIQIGALGSMVPERKRDLSMIGFRAMIAGSIACFMTACVAGTLITEADQLSNGNLNATI